MTRLLLIIALLTQMGCGVFLQTTAGTFVGTLSADIMKDELEEDDDEKKVLRSERP